MPAGAAKANEVAKPDAEPKAPIILSIEGNIGTGKSTLLERLQLEYANDSSIGFLQEPIDVWNTIKDSSGKTILEKYYADQKKYAFSFQMMAYISRLSILRQSLKSNYRVIIIERSIHTDAAVFAKMLFDNKKIEEIEYNIYMKWFHEFIGDLPPIKFVYVRAEPQISLERVIKRGRLGEEIPLDYLINCHNYHEDWLMNKNRENPLLVLDANHDIYTDSEKLREWIDKITNFMID